MQGRAVCMSSLYNTYLYNKCSLSRGYWEEMGVAYGEVNTCTVGLEAVKSTCTSVWLKGQETGFILSVHDFTAHCGSPIE